MEALDLHVLINEVDNLKSNSLTFIIIIQQGQAKKIKQSLFYHYLNVFQLFQYNKLKPLHTPEIKLLNGGRSLSQKCLNAGMYFIPKLHIIILWMNMFQAKIQQTKIAVKTIYFSLHIRNSICRQAQSLFTSASQTVSGLQNTAKTSQVNKIFNLQYTEISQSAVFLVLGIWSYVNAICAMYENRSAQQCSSFELATLRHKWSHIPTRLWHGICGSFFLSLWFSRSQVINFLK